MEHGFPADVSTVLAGMWARGGYSMRARLTAIAVWGGLMVLGCAAAAVMIQSQMATLLNDPSRFGVVPGGGLDAARAGIGMLAYGGSLLLVAIVAPAGMGMGDVKLAALIGLVLGALGLRYVAVAAGAGILLGGVGAIAALVAGASRKQAIPFGPFLAAGALVAAFLAPQIATVYLRHFT